MTVGSDASLEDTIYEMMAYKVGILPVVQNNQVVLVLSLTVMSLKFF
ncbi:hypothetical protein SCR05_02315 [Streptococcus canis]|nr:hypothetical protein [Streptococcus canis]MDW7796448.1 hypothetical protein [Streptococcus canis]